MCCCFLNKMNSSHEALESDTGIVVWVFMVNPDCFVQTPQEICDADPHQPP